MNIVKEHAQSSASSAISKFDGKLVCFVTVKPFDLSYYMDMSHSGQKPTKNDKGKADSEY